VIYHVHPRAQVYTRRLPDSRTIYQVILRVDDDEQVLCETETPHETAERYAHTLRMQARAMQDEARAAEGGGGKSWIFWLVIGACFRALLGC
jgi:hypothetical protein